MSGQTLQVKVASTVNVESFTAYRLLQKENVEDYTYLAPTEVVTDGPLVVDDDDEWAPISGSWTAYKHAGGGFVVHLRAGLDDRLVSGAEVRFTRAECDIAESITRLPIVLNPNITLEIPVNLKSGNDTEIVSGLEVRQPPSIAQVSTDKVPIPSAIALKDLDDAGYTVGSCARNGGASPRHPRFARTLSIIEYTTH